MITLTIEHIVRDPGKRSGKPYIAGTGITVQHIAELHHLGWNIEDFIQEFELTAGQVYAALSYYADHQEEIDRAIQSATEKVQNSATSIEGWQHQIKARQANP